MTTKPASSKSKAELSRILTRRLQAHPLWDEIINSIVLQNSSGKVWLIGGSVSRVLCEELYGTKMGEFDFDFIVAKLRRNPTAPSGWKISYSKFNNPTFTKDSISVDLWSISDDHWIRQNKLKPLLKNFFEGTPFTIQAMAYDIKEKKVVGNLGIEALLSRKFAVNNIKTANEDAQRKGVTINQRLEYKAKSMDFTFVSTVE